MRRQDVEHQIRDSLGDITDAGLLAAYLFGSVARDDHGPHSDIDVAVLFADQPPKSLAHPSVQLSGMLEERVGRPVQVVALNDAPPDLVHRVLRDGQLVIDRDPSRRIRFEVKARNEYFDLLPLLRAYRRREGRPL